MMTRYGEYAKGYSPWHQGRRRLVGMAMAVAMAAATLVPAGPASAASEAASGDVFTFVGGGFGHSVGLSQFGAYGMALEGYEYDAILRHYYTGHHHRAGRR